MVSRPSRASAPGELLDRLRERLEVVESLTSEVRVALRDGDAPRIETATARLETVALEFRLLHQEFLRLPADRRDSRDPELDRSRAALRETLERVLRSAAVGSGLLARLVAMARGLVGAAGAGHADAYLASGRPCDLAGEGLQLRETI